MTAGLAEAKRIGGLEVPVLSFANELVGICSYWADPRADHIVVPSEEARRDLMRFGVPESKLSFVGFGYPVRQAFLNAPPSPRPARAWGSRTASPAWCRPAARGWGGTSASWCGRCSARTSRCRSWS